MSYEYADNNRAQRCSRAAARGGIPFFGPNTVVSGLWSATNTNLRPYRYWWNFRIPRVFDVHEDEWDQTHPCLPVPPLFALFSAASMPWAISPAFVRVRLASDKRRFWMLAFLRPHTRRSLNASLRYSPNHSSWRVSVARQGTRRWIRWPLGSCDGSRRVPL